MFEVTTSYYVSKSYHLSLKTGHGRNFSSQQSILLSTRGEQKLFNYAYNWCCQRNNPQVWLTSRSHLTGENFSQNCRGCKPRNQSNIIQKVPLSAISCPSLYYPPWKWNKINKDTKTKGLKAVASPLGGKRFKLNGSDLSSKKLSKK